MFSAAKGLKKEDLKFLAEEIGVAVPPSVTISALKKLIQDSSEYKEDPDFLQEVLMSAIADRKLREQEEKTKRLEEERARKEEERAKKEEERAKKEEEERARKEEERARKDEEEKARRQEESAREEERVRREQEERKIEHELEERKMRIQLELEKTRMEHELELARIQAQGRRQSVTDSSDSDVNSKRKFTLPKLEFRKFADDIKEWLPFWSQFEHIHKDEEIASEDKFQYLIQATVVGSRAREVVESFPPTGANYEKAVESLKSRFGREDILVEVYVRELLKLIITVQTKEKEKFSLTYLYDKLESYLRALETLGVTTDMNASILYPMVESCFPVEFLKAWNRGHTSGSKYDAKEQLKKLMDFLKTEVEGEERISLAMAGLGFEKGQDRPPKKKCYDFEKSREKVPTAAGLLTTSSTTEVKKSCIFCEGKHKSAECFSARKMSLSERQKIVRDKGCCYACLCFGHTAKKCRAFLKCNNCSRKHLRVMCPNLDQNKSMEFKEIPPSDAGDGNGTPASIKSLNSLHSHSVSNVEVFLQTLVVRAVGEKRVKRVRAVIDTGSQRSYILKSTAKELGYQAQSEQIFSHSLFGGEKTKERKHLSYKIILEDLNGSYACDLDALDQELICNGIPSIREGPWLKQLEVKKIRLSDVGSRNLGPIEVLLGADVVGKLFTGRKEVLKSGLVAMETKLGWTLMGKVPLEETPKEDMAMAVVSMFVNEADISSLWRLDVLGINDPIERKSKQEIDFQTKEHFLETITFNSDGRYEVCLPWADDKSPLPDNFSLAKKRLDNTTSKLEGMNLYQKYEGVFADWLAEGIIEEVPQSEIRNYGNYLPHRPVIKMSSSTTPIRPVFDASARLPNHPSLNQCLECGPNLIELIPDLLLRFRERKFGVVADIRKAFCQISIRPEDRDFLRFLWWENMEEKKLKVFRHARVVFGVKCSPFLLASVIEYHIEKNEDYDAEFRRKLAQSFYVDNVVTSVDTEEELDRFILDSKNLMSKGGFDLRGWEYTGDGLEAKEKDSHVLGLIWNKESDTVKIDMNWTNEFDVEKVTKRSMLSSVHKVFDPFGFASPVMLCPKIMLQEAWRKGITWDEEINCELRREFLKWFQELSLLGNIAIPRYIQVTESLTSCTIHTFVDGSKDAYAAVTFLRIEKENAVELFLLAAKSRVAPLRGSTIPRMELLAAVIGARLTNSIVVAMQWENIEKYYWSDATTVLAWIERDENWSVFVRNRVKEIRSLSDPSSWKHVPGEKNPADLPSRGCKASSFISSKWWEGPLWMKDPDVYRSLMDSSVRSWNEEEISKEKSKTSCSLLTNVRENDNEWYFKYFSDYGKIVRLVGWILRFRHNCLNQDRKSGELTTSEFQAAEVRVIRLIQARSFISENDGRLKSLQAFNDEHGVIRLKTKISHRKDSEDFLQPAVLPHDHEVVRRLIMHIHKKNCHAGVQLILNLLREKYWVLHARRTVKEVLNRCVVCKRFSSKSIEPLAPPLPENRVKDAAVFQVTGIDMAGPLFLKENKKCWVLIFTCAVYRAVHLELVTSASTDAFLMAFRRFVARRGRCSTVYCDNGTNFVGAANSLKKLDWNRILRYGSVNAIDWKLNPPTAAWWGGFWERLIRIMKDLLKRVLGRASLNYEEMATVLADCESVINSRPLTYIDEDEVLKPLSPSMFLQDIQEHQVPDIDTVDRESLTRRVKYRQTLLKDVRNRFRTEYLGMLILRGDKGQPRGSISAGDIVLVGADNKKRIDWPIGRISKLIPGKDGKVRLVKVQTAHQELLRPVQRVYPLEISSSKEVEVLISKNQSSPSQHPRHEEACRSLLNEPKFSRYGRQLKAPERLKL